MPFFPSFQASMDFLIEISRFFIFPALLAWTLVFASLLRRIAASLRRSV